MSIIKQEASFVAAGYNFETVNGFDEQFLNSKAQEEFGNTFEHIQIANFKINNTLLPKDFPTPFSIYRNNNNEEIRYDNLSKRLDIISLNYNEDKQDKLKKLFLKLAQFRAQEISQIGLNFTIEYDKKQDRLNIFNSQIDDKVKIFPKNIGFNIVLPVDLTDILEHNCIGTYNISKDDTIKNEGHIYTIIANFNFILKADKADPIKRVEEIKNIIDKTDLIYKNFEDTYKQIIGL